MLITDTPQQNTALLIPKLSQQLKGMMNNDCFNIDFWRQQNAITGKSQGRNITWFIAHDNDEWVLRHYYRGGFIKNFLEDQYFFISFEKTRCYQELELLEKMYNQGLPVPKPIAARIIKKGLFFYQADLLIEKIPLSRDLVQVLQKESLSEQDWYSLGEMIARFHLAGIYHSDLNSHNILLDHAKTFWLIDFDRCDERPPEKAWQQKNLARLKRSLKKEQTIYKDFHFDRLNWHWLIHGYDKYYSSNSHQPNKSLN